MSPRRAAGLLLLAAALAPAAATHATTPPQAQAHPAPPAPAAAAGGLPGPEASASRADLLDALFARLHEAGDAPEARAIAGSIRALWAHPDSPGAELLIRQADKALKAGHGETALRILTLVTRNWPDLAEGWRNRAVARYMMDDPQGALADLDRALEIEPRHFEALFLKAAILQETGHLRQALAAYEEVLLVYPGMKPAQEAARALRLKADQDI